MPSHRRAPPFDWTDTPMNTYLDRAVILPTLQSAGETHVSAARSIIHMLL